jgi:hypothetical protein
MKTDSIYKSTASVLILIILAALVSVYLAACSQFDAEATVNPITGSARIHIKAAK